MIDTTVVPLESRRDYERVIDYFLGADQALLDLMGVDPRKLPERDAWLDRVCADLDRDDREKQTFYVGWKSGGEFVGHSNLNPIRYGADANMHLHIWRPGLRRAGLGTRFVKQTVPIYFERFELERLFCEPRAENAAPNRTLLAAGFRHVRTYRTIPGAINYEQDVSRYELRRPN